MKKTILAGFFLFVSSTTSVGASVSYLVRIPYKGPRQVADLTAAGADVVSASPQGYLEIAVPSQLLPAIMARNEPLALISSSQQPSARRTLDENLGLYHTYAEMASLLSSLASSYPQLARLDTLGYSNEGRIVFCLKISDNVSLDEDEGEVLIMGNHHARELMTVEIPLKLAQYLLSNYGIDPQVTYLVDNREIYLVPMVNPDGHVYVELHHSGAWWTWWRKNRRNNGDGTYGVDLNRNYGYMWGYDNFGSSPYTYSSVYRGSGPFSEPETQAIRDLCQGRNFSLSLSYHSYGELILYPWGYYFGYTPDHSVFSALADTMALSNGYFPGNPIEGAIYITNGDTDDWGYGETNTKNSFFAFTVEINSGSQGGFAPPDSLIDPTFDMLLPMNLEFLSLAAEPRRVVGPESPTMYAITGSPYWTYTLSWSSSPPSDPNPPVGFELLEYANPKVVTDSCESFSKLWSFDGFSLSSLAYEGASSYYSGSGNSFSATMTTVYPIKVSADFDTFSCMMWYQTEANYDYAYVKVSEDYGTTWTPIGGNITTSSNPNGQNHGHGITGSSGGWVKAIFPLTDYMGRDVLLRIHYLTDGSVYYQGLYVDLIDAVPTCDSLKVLASGLTDTTYMVIDQPPGTYSYRVRGRDAEGQWSGFSNSVAITVDAGVASRNGFVPSSSLSQNYPNPFNPTTTIPFFIGPELASGDRVRAFLAVYSSTGSLVKVLLQEPLPPGIHQARWDGSDQQGRPVASGIYFLRLELAGGKSFCRKAVLLR